MQKITEKITVAGYTAELMGYTIEKKNDWGVQDKHATIIICPGGGYHFVSDREADPVALKLITMGYNAFVLNYTCQVRYPVALEQLAQSVKLVRDNADEWNVREDKIIIMGMSAGGHLAASLGVKWNSDELKQMGYKPEEIKPNGLVLSYPVITTNKDFWHQGSFEQILGKDGIEDEKALANQSLEKLVTEDVPPVFMWHTFEDKAVPMENSLLLASALRKAGVSTEYHIFPHGPHGLALANEETARVGRPEDIEPQAAQWVDLFHSWMQALLK